MTGDGSDELFAGYSRYQHYARGYRQRRVGIGNQLLGRLPTSVSIFLTRLLKSNQRMLSRELLREKVARYQRAYASEKPRDYYREQIAYWQDPELAVPGIAIPSYGMNTTAIRADEIATFQWCDINNYLPDDILVKVDRAAMANSLETRVPLLDHRLVELSLRVPTRLNLGGDGAKQPLRRILYRHVPRELIDRPKQGFALPKASWLRNELREWAEDLLSEQALKATGYFDTHLIRRKWQAHLTTEHDYAFHLWSILMFQCWYNEYMR
jgi:asparagine synthase (glutamine-hydrolysing)